jgi:hypothetical protein
MLVLLAASLAGGHYGEGKHVWVVTIGAMVKMKKVRTYMELLQGLMISVAYIASRFCSPISLFIYLSCSSSRYPFSPFTAVF